MREPLVILGSGFLGAAAARQAISTGRRVVGTTRSAERAEFLAKIGVEPVLAPRLESALVHSLVSPGSSVLVTFPPDEPTDEAVLPALSRAGSTVYISSTGVYGDASGRIDEDTPVDTRSPRAASRLAAEKKYLEKGAVVLRAAAIYGPGRGLHVRVARGEHKISDDGRRVVSRIHVDDLAMLALAALERGLRGEVFVAADAAPVPQIEVLQWLCARLGAKPPENVARESLPETLQHDRAVDASKILRTLGVSLVHPTYREGFTACIEAEKSAR